MISTIRNIKTIAQKEFLHIKADPLMMRLIVFPVLAQLFIVGYALTTEVKNTPVAFLDRSRSPESIALVERVTHSPLFATRGWVRSEAEIREMLARGEIKIGIVIPENFSSRLRDPRGAPLQLVIDGQDANSSSVATGYLNAIISQWVLQRMDYQLRSQGMRADAVMPVWVTPTVLYNPMLKSSWYMIPGLVVILVTMITSLLTGLSIVREKERGTFEQLMVTPLQPLQVVLGKIIPFAIIGLGEICAFLLLATLWFGIPFRGSLVTLFGFALMYMVSSLGIGIFTSTVARTSQQVLFLVWFILLFFLLLSGFFIPIENMPKWVQTITLGNPVRFFMFAIREIFLKASGFEELWREALAMGCIGATVFGLSLLFFSRKAA